MLVLGHRGYHVLAPENTLEAFKEAQSLGADGVETDVRLSADRVPVLFHDRLVDDIPVAKLAHGELSQRAGYEVPTLENAFAEFPGMFWNLEVKVSEVVDAVVDILLRRASLDRILVSSFWHPLVENICSRVPVEGGLLVAHRPSSAELVDHWLLTQKLVRTLVWDFETCDRQLLSRASKHGARNFVYGALSEQELNQLRGWNVEGVITDRPDRILMR